ncbi:HU family DNA-binding protein [Fibrella sp. ES10-3-2-2]|nr:hypothetical protein A6C57_00980 [Fibrella sp. ES10-3-2-2]
MTKQELATDVADQYNKVNTDMPLITPQQAQKIIDATAVVMRETVAKGETVYIRGFGSLGPKHRAAKVARNIGKGTTLEIPAHMTPAFKPAPDFIEQVRTSVKAKVMPF